MRLSTITEIIIGCIVNMTISALIVATAIIATGLIFAYVLWDITIYTKTFSLILQPIFLRITLLVFITIIIAGINDDIKWKRRFEKEVEKMNETSLQR